ncbi:MAG: hypothetical protein Q9183_002673 [Haloplaca sp. 2 TL-2023]
MKPLHGSIPDPSRLQLLTVERTSTRLQETLTRHNDQKNPPANTKPAANTGVRPQPFVVRDFSVCKFEQWDARNAGNFGYRNSGEIAGQKLLQKKGRADAVDN